MHGLLTAWMVAGCVLAAGAASPEPAPWELVPNGDFSIGYPLNPQVRGATRFSGWFVSAQAEPGQTGLTYALAQETGCLALTRLTPGVRLALLRPSIGLDATGSYRLSLQVRQTGGTNARVEVSGAGVYPVPPGDGWQAMNLSLTLPDTPDKPAIRNNTAFRFVPPDDVGGTLAVRSVSLQPVLPDTIEPRDKTVLIETESGPAPLEAIFVRRGAGAGDLLAAHDLRLALYGYAGYSIPVIFYEPGPAPGRRGVYIGGAALDRGLIRPAELDGLGLNGYVRRCAGGQAGLCGAGESGTVCGSAALARELGIHLLARNEHHIPYRDEVSVPEGDSVLIRAGFVRRVPAFAYTLWHGGPARMGVPMGFAWPTAFLGDSAEMGAGCAQRAHNADYFVPFEVYGETHPEYFAMDSRGERLKMTPGQRFDVHLCTSNPDVQRIAAERLLQWMERQRERIFFACAPGDGTGYCECPACRALDPDPGSVSKTDRYLAFVNGLARAAAARFPDKRLCLIAYTDQTEAPPVRERPEPNVDVIYCLWATDWRCKQHAFCMHNQEGLDHLDGWLTLMPGRVHVFDYPGYTVADAERLRYFHQRGVVGVQHCGFSGMFPELTAWVLSRMAWDMDLDREAATDEFMRLYYGGAAPAVRQYYTIVQDALTRYTHEGEAALEGASHGHHLIRRPVPLSPRNPALLTAEEMDRAYASCAEAVRRVTDDPVRLKRVRNALRPLLMVDLTQRNPVRGLDGLSEAAFARRLSEFLSIARDGSSDQVYYNTPMDQWLRDVAGLDVPLSGWRTHPAVLEIIARPEAALADGAPAPLPIAGGWRVPAANARGGESGTLLGQPAVILRRPSSGYGQARFLVALTAAPPAETRLVIEGLDDEKPGRALWQAQVNGRALAEGPNAFGEQAWTQLEWKAPAGAFRAGTNEVLLLNRTPDTGPGERSRAVDIEGAGQIIHDYTWGWIGIAGLEVLTP